MPVQLKTFFWVAFLILIRFPVQGIQQDERQDINWYETFFQEEKPGSVEKAFARSTAKLQHAREANNPGEEAQALKELALLHLTRMSDYDQAMDLLVQSLAIEDSLNLKNNKIFTYLAIAQVFEEVGYFNKCAQFLNQAMELNEEFNNVSILALILNKLGKINAAMGNDDEAFENYQLVLEYKDRIQQPKVEADALFNLAHLYAKQGNYKQALQNHKKALAIRRSDKDKKNEALSLNDIGELYRFMKNDERALANHVAALEIRQGLNDVKGIAESYNNIGVLYFEQKNYERAVANLELALQAARESQASEQMQKSYEYLSLCYKALEDYQKALEFKENFLSIYDFIQNEKNERQLLEIQNRYVMDKRESQIDKLELDRRQREKELLNQKKVRNFLMALVGLGLVIVVLVFRLYLQKQHSNRILQEANTKVHHQNEALQDLNAMKDKFFSIISHDLKGPLNSLTSFSTLLINHTDSLSKEEIQMLAKDLDKSIKNLFALLENLLEWSRSQTGSIEFQKEVFDLGALLNENIELLAGQAQNKNITVTSEGARELPVRAHRQSINTVVRNLLSNAIKFTPNGGTITLRLEQTGRDAVVSVADSGVGMSADVIKKLFRIDTKHSTRGTADEKGTGLGLILCKEFVEKNGGKIWVKSQEGKGSVFSFALPV